MIKNLTEGKPESVLWRFSIPLFISVIFQQMYNISDSVIAGKFAGENALAAIGASFPITMIFMSIAVGSNVGCSVVISQLFGAKKLKDMKTAILTTVIACIVLSVALTIIGLWQTQSLMRLINTPDNIFLDGAIYLKIYIAGFIFIYLYNVCTGIFASLGDSKTPLYFLIGSSLANIMLAYLFVAKFHWGVAGTGWATFIAQGLACVLCSISLFNRVKLIKTDGKIVLFSWDMLKKVSRVAVPSILQQSFVSIGNIFVQVLINGYGSSVIAGYSAAVKLNTFAITSFATLANGLSSFTAQNIGAGKIDRVKRGFRAGIILSIIVAVPFVIAYGLFGSSMIKLFLNEDSAVALNIGVVFLKIISPFYFVILLKLMSDGVLRGSGSMKQFMIATFSDLILRVVLAFVLVGQIGTNGIWLSWPIGWSIGTVLSCAFYRSGKWKRQV